MEKNLVEGPIDQIIPERRFKSCVNCKFFYHNHQMIRSGLDPLYDTAMGCTHENFKDERISTRRMMGKPGRNIPPSFNDEIHTPDWCPYLTNNEG